MTYASYTRDDLVAGLRNHFGLTSNTDNNNILIAALDEAVGEIIRKRRSWHFLERDLVIDIAPSKSGTGTFAIGSDNMEVTAGTDPDVYDILIDSDTSAITEGFRVTAFSTPNATLDANYVSASGSKSYTSTVGWHVLPENFMSMDGPLWDVENIRARIFYRPPPEFENIRNSKTIAVGRPLYYTVVSDPIAENSPQLTDRKQYLMVYPYAMDRTTLRGKYQVHPQKLDNASAIPILPREYRPVLIDAARWQASILLHQEVPTIQFYFQRFKDAITDMLKEYEFVDDVDDVAPGRGPGFDLPIEGSPSLGDDFPDWGT